jgi:hypothetical protein
VCRRKCRLHSAKTLRSAQDACDAWTVIESPFLNERRRRSCRELAQRFIAGFGSLDDVRREVAVHQERYADVGLIIGPTHAIQPLTPVEDMAEMYRAIGSLNAV